MTKLGRFAAACAAVVVGLSAGTLQAAQVAKFVEYIESTGTQWIDTGYFVSPQTKIEADFQFTANSAQYRVMGSESGDFIVAMYQNASGYWGYSFQDKSGNWVSSGVKTDKNRHAILFDGPNRVFKIDDGATVNVAISGTATKMATVSLGIGAANKGTSGVANISKHRVYSFKIYEAGALQRDYQPCVDTDGKAGLCDLLSGDILYNQGTGTDYSVGGVVNLQRSDMLTVSAAPAELGEPGTPYGIYLNLAAGEEKTLAAFDGEWTDGATKATCTGWKLYAWDDEKGAWVASKRGTGTTCDYTHPDPAVAMKLEWQLDATYKIVGGTAEEGAALPAEQWVKHGQLGKVTAVSDTAAIFDWTGDTVNASAIGQDLLFQVVGPRTVTPVFAGQTLYVAETGNDETGDGTEENPFASPKKALDTIHPLFTAGEITTGSIVVGPGTYRQTDSLFLTNAIRVVGSGWTNCVLKQTKSAANMRVVTMSNGAKLVGVTCTGGRANGAWASGAGSGIQMGSAGDPCTVSWCCISNNVAGGNNIHGAAINACKGTIDHCLIAGNTASYGGAGGSGTGGGIGYYSGGGALTIDTCLICNNKCPAGAGGGIRNESNTMTIRNTTIAGNTASSGGGGIYTSSDKMTLKNCLIADNTANNDTGAGKPNWGASTDAIKNTVSGKTSCCLWGNGCELLGNEANCSVGNAMFRSLSAQDYRLEANSDAIGMGDAAGGLPLDLDGKVRNLSGSCVGCYEYDAASEPFKCLIDAFDDEAFIDESVVFSATPVNPPEGATLGYTWYFSTNTIDEAVTRTGNPLVLTGLAAGVYSVAVVATDSVSGTASDMTVAEGTLHVAVHTNYVTSAKNPNAAYPYATPETAAESVNTALGCVIDGSVVVLDEGRHPIAKAVNVTKSITLSGQGRDRTTVYRNASGNMRLLQINHSEAVVKDLTLEGGKTGEQWGTGAGVYFGSLGGTVRDCRVRGCTSSGTYEVGAAVFMSSSGSMLENCVVCCNTNGATSTNGGGDYWGQAGILCVYGGGTVRNVLVERNVCSGVSPILGASANVLNCTIVSNEVSGANATAIHIAGARVENCLFWGNQAPNNTQTAATVGVPNWTISSASAANKVKNCCWDGSDDLGSACAKKGDVQFVDPAAGDYRIRPRSTCFNAGLYDATWMDDATDLDGNPRVKGKRPDIGCYECQDVLGLMLLVR